MTIVYNNKYYINRYKLVIKIKMFVNTYLFILIISLIITLTKSSKSCDFTTKGNDFTIEFKGIIKKNPTTFGSLFNYIFGNKKDIYCTGEWKMKSKNDNHTYKLTYYGDIKDGIPHGVGLNTIINNNYYFDNNIQTKYFYKGNWLNGYKEGFGIQTMINIEIEKNNQTMITTQEGIFANNDIIQGVEFSYFVEKNICYEYNGKFLYNRPHGYGSKYYNNGTVFEGEFEHGNIIKITNTILDIPFNCLEKAIQSNLAV